MRFHDLRHTTATLLLRAGIDPHRVQRLLRHASITTTTGTYGHLLVDDLRAAVALLGPEPTQRSEEEQALAASAEDVPAAPGFAPPVLRNGEEEGLPAGPLETALMSEGNKVSRVGIEPTTLGLKGRCSTN